VPCQLGGGIRDEATISRMLALGIDRLVIGSRALDAPGWFREMCRRFEKRLVLGIDARDGRVASGGWLRTSQQDAVELARDFAAEPLAAIVFTDIARDGMLSGPNYAALEAVRRATPLPVIASGGVSSVDHVTGLARAGLAGCIIGRALYEGKITIAQARAASRPPGGVKLVEP
jgi:phosphoribosylformimino-5-aminoimidazole carboxamide ribotide isomerase